MKVKTKRRRLSAAERLRIVRLHEEGFSDSAIARMVNRSRNCIDTVLCGLFPVYVADPAEPKDRRVRDAETREEAEAIVKQLNAEAMRQPRRPAPLYYCGTTRQFRGWESVEVLFGHRVAQTEGDHESV